MKQRSLLWRRQEQTDEVHPFPSEKGLKSRAGFVGSHCLTTEILVSMSQELRGTCLAVDDWARNARHGRDEKHANT